MLGERIVMIKKLTNQLLKMLSKKDTVNAKIKEVAKKLQAYIEKTRKELDEADEVLARISNM